MNGCYIQEKTIELENGEILINDIRKDFSYAHSATLR